MPKNTTPYLYNQDSKEFQSFANADGTSWKTVATAGADGSGLYELSIVSTDTVARNMSFRVVNGANNATIRSGQVVAANQGNNSANPAPLRLIQELSNFLSIRLLDKDQNYYVPLAVGDTIQARMDVAVTSGQTVSVLAVKKDF